MSIQEASDDLYRELTNSFGHTDSSAFTIVEGCVSGYGDNDATQ